jgi:hypothetical protein
LIIFGLIEILFEICNYFLQLIPLLQELCLNTLKLSLVLFNRLLILYLPILIVLLPLLFGPLYLSELDSVALYVFSEFNLGLGEFPIDLILALLAVRLQISVE